MDWAKVLVGSGLSYSDCQFTYRGLRCVAPFTTQCSFSVYRLWLAPHKSPGASVTSGFGRFSWNGGVVRTVVVPAAGMGTRFLLATKTVPKELLPVVDTPGIELIAQEAAACGAQRLAVVVAPNKEEIMRHFGDFAELQDLMVARGKHEQAD